MAATTSQGRQFTFFMIGMRIGKLCHRIFVSARRKWGGRRVLDFALPGAAATASGLVDGIGHLGAIFSPYVVVFVSERYGWDSLFFLLGGAAFLAGAVLIPIWNLKPSNSVPVAMEESALEPVACVAVE